MNLFFEKNLRTFLLVLTVCCAVPSAKSQSNSRVVTYVASDGPRIYYVSSNQHLNEMGYHGSAGWGNFDVTALAASGTLVGPGTGIATYLASDGPRIYYVSSNQHLNEVGYHGSSGWINFDVTALAGSGTLAAMGTGIAVY